MVIDGAMNGEAFTAYAETILAPVLSAGDIVVTDNLPAHKVSGARAAIESAARSSCSFPPTLRDAVMIECVTTMFIGQGASKARRPVQ